VNAATRRLAGVCACLLLSLHTGAADAQTCLRTTDEYDRHFQSAVRRHWATELPNADWRLLKAQCWVESNLDPNAESWAGAVGLCQFLGATWREAQGRIDLRTGNRRDGRDSVEAAAWYMAGRARFWSEPRPEVELWRLAAVGYNSGSGNWYKAQVRYGGRYWRDLVPHIGEFVGERNEREAAGYAPKIEDAYKRIGACGGRRR